MRYIPAFIVLGLLASTSAYAQSTQSQSATQPQAQTENQASQEQQQQPQLSQKFIRQMQRRLQQAGVYQGQPSGTWDEETADALEQFQQERGLASNGEIDGATLLALMRPQMRQQGTEDGQNGAEGSSAGPAQAANGHPMLRAYERGYQEGFQQGFSAAQQETQQEQ